MEIFSAYAPRYWAKGLPVIPLKAMDKMPFFDDWSKWCLTMPTEQEQASWVSQYKGNNIGLPCGPQSGLVMIDVDTVDTKVQEAIMNVLPKSPWIRVGQKGMMIALKFNKTPSSKILGEDRRPIVEIISTGGQIVLPPSIHPKTMKPYTATGDLFDMMEQIPIAPDDIDAKLRAAISTVVKLEQKGGQATKFNASRIVPKGQRDVEMVRNAGKLAFSVRDGEISLMEALNHMRGWFNLYVEKDQIDPLDIDKGINKICEFLQKDVKSGKVLPPTWDKGMDLEMKKSLGMDFSEDAQEWEAGELIKFITEQYKETGPNDVKREITQRFVLTKIARSSKLDPLDVDRIFRELKADSKTSLATFKKIVNEMQSGPIEGISHTEVAEAVIVQLTERHAQMAYHDGEIFSWEGSHWAPLKDQVVRSVVQKHYGHLDLAKRFSDHNAIVNVCKDLVPQQIRAEVAIDGINFANGFMNRDKQLVAHAPEQGMTYTLPFQYRPELAGKMPIFNSYLESVWGKDEDFEEKKLALKQAICTTLFGVGPAYQRAVLLYGAPSSGKSVLMKVLMAMVPKHAVSAISPYKWSTDQYAAAEFSEKLLNFCGELSESQYIESDIFKLIVDGTTMDARRPYGQFFKFDPRCVHWFCSNYLPKSRDITDGFNRRWLILSFNHKVPDDQKILGLENIIIQNELESIVAWALDAWLDLSRKADYSLPKSHRYHAGEMALGNSTVRQWYQAKMVRKEGVLVTEQTLYKDYWSYCSASLQGGTKSSKNFGTDLEKILQENGFDNGKYQDGQIIHSGWAIRGQNG